MGESHLVASQDSLLSKLVLSAVIPNPGATDDFYERLSIFICVSTSIKLDSIA